MKRLCLYICLLLLTEGLPACDDCGPSAEIEPRVELTITTSPARLFRLREVVQAVYGLGALTQQALTIPADTSRQYSHQLALPINLRADQVRYVLVNQNRADTITVNYQRIFTYKDNKCGYLLDVRPPSGFQYNPTTLPLAAQTTLGKVSSVYYQGTQPSGSGWAPSRLSVSDIYLSLLIP